MLLSYFGEKKSKSCGKCDVCLSIHKEQVKKAEFDQIASAVFEKVKTTHYNFRKLVFSLSDEFAEEQVVKVVRWLADQGKLKLED